jgi:hypothetical protein
MNELGEPPPRYGHVLVWNGEEMIVWGGAESSSSILFDTDGRYDPATDTWSPPRRSTSTT